MSTPTASNVAAGSSTPVPCPSHQVRSRQAAPGAAYSFPYIGASSTGTSLPVSASRDRIPAATEWASW
ncbi:hypothetical protein MMF93_14820 [Streptomyces tubbatahanensis]|uniref:Uncharacterized protein n=1 Tax=Streptomyces tubbatahanensis TaxID=2923272 RepID=A0ABY3Y499_9ACTN|nr:hypothetical protein [Streptomyces tubbatahanensis]UNT01395.1 hypothetical protein MMF93_14820 [Streptomyces tubbatahanensis]